jgi:hypothetical protein
VLVLLPRNNKNNKKKAQVTLFIIIGIVLLIATTLFFVIRQTVFEKEPLVEISEIKNANQLKAAVTNYVETCLKPITLQGLEILRLQGGYIDLPSGTTYKDIKDMNDESVSLSNNRKKVVIDESSIGNKVPFWVTRTSIAIPSLELIRYQLINYIARELFACINNFEPFKQNNFDVVQQTLSANVTFGKSVVVDISLPVSFKKEDVNIDMEKYSFSVPINLPKVHDIALTLALGEYKTAYLEFVTNNLWGLYSGVDSRMLPPFRHTIVNTDGRYVTWVKSSVEMLFNRILEQHIPFVSIKNTDFTDRDGIYNSFEFDFFKENHPEVTVTHKYSSSWKFNDFEVNPNPISPTMFEEMDIPLLPSFYVFKYKFKYDIEFPVLVSVTDKDSARINPLTNLFEEKGGYTLQFLDDVVVYGNQPRALITNSFRAGSGAENDLLQDIDTAALEAQGINILPDTYFCDEEQKLSRNITIEIKDKKTNEPLEGTNIFYECGSYRSTCIIGRTGADGKIITKFPLCQNGMLKFSKEGYTQKKEMMSVSINETKILSYKLSPFYKLKANIKKYKMTEPGQLGALLSLESGDKVTLSVTKPDGASFDMSANNALMFGQGLSQNDITLTPGDYEVIGLLLTDGLTIPEKCKRTCTKTDGGFLGTGIGGGDCEEWEYLPEEPIVMDKGANLGGVNLDQSNRYWSITEEQLSSAEEVTFYIIEVPTPTCIDEANNDKEECLIPRCIGIIEMAQTGNYSTVFRQNLEPRLS